MTIHTAEELADAADAELKAIAAARTHARYGVTSESEGKR